MIDDLNDMLIFAEVVRSGSITRAGERLSLPKATVSRRLSKLEARLGTRLLHKTTRRLELTEVGEAYYERCLPILEEVEETRDFASQLSNKPRGRLRVTAPGDFAMEWLAVPLATFCAAYPEITVEIDLSSRQVDLIAERVDVAIRAGHLSDSTLVARPLLELSRSLYASPLYLASTGMPSTPDELEGHRFVILQGARRVFNTDTLSRGRQRADITMHGAIQANSMGMVKEMALAGSGIAALTDILAQPGVAAGRLVRVLPEWSLPSSPVHLVTPSRRFLPRKTQVFIEHLLAVARTCPDEFRNPDVPAP
ncbi:LysR family transcriptional regulator [Pandoraea terrae]|uniref:LysR family transcriptional regulator n=1 Tax=Pandoraea terrae TaxID=1537710 RepID=A0A5E4XPM4_9BURK|nr:LysR family transcriptional regulator [Pandoraea terrae]VVE38002.1 LysR family transcriptional regulator [Pandoraea terrae]